MNKLKSIGSLLLAVSLVVPLLIGCGGVKPVKPEAEKKVKIGYLSFDTGPVADCSIPGIVYDYIRHVNETGGIHGTGVKIELIHIDSGYDVARCISAYDKMAYSDKVLAIVSHATACTDATVDKSKRDKMPIINSYSGGPYMVWPVADSMSYMTAPTHCDVSRGALKWVREVDWPKKGKPGKPKIGFITADIPFGWTNLSGALSGAKMYGFETPAPIAWEGLTVMDATASALALKPYNLDYIWITFTQHGISMVARDLMRQGVAPPASLLVFGAGADPACIPRSEGAMVGAPIFVPWSAWTDDLPGVKKFRDIVMEYHPGFDPVQPSPALSCSLVAFIGFGFAAEAVAKAMEDVGYEGLSRDAFFKACGEVKGVNFFDFITFDASPTVHRASRMMKMVTLTKDGLVVSISDFFEVPKETPAWERRGEFKPPAEYIPK